LVVRFFKNFFGFRRRKMRKERSGMREKEDESCDLLRNIVEI
jgi:hypothetical protein